MGLLNLAIVPCPSADPEFVLLPANVVTTGKAEHADRDEHPTKA
jgi:hypothetical protein